jgi:hypothetical protein
MRPYLKKTPSQKKAGGVAQGVGPEYKPQHHEKKKKIIDTSPGDSMFRVSYRSSSVALITTT